jgi:hypothetical protein
MLHTQISESLDSNPPQKVLVGFVGDGGYGSHPTIITPLKLENLDDSYYFFPLLELDEIPEALLCIESEENNDLWDFKPISNELAQQIMGISDTDFYSNDEKNSETKQAFEIAGIDLGKIRSGEWNGQKWEERVFKMFSVIPNIQLNSIYWSENPERTHGYWEPPYTIISL